ncbi:MAG: hypothetical protein J7J98_08695 [candidate division Zixibacteria bacterium]|nr:hypothetical protein [candidate division Zixibacteria bacterium]
MILFKRLLPFLLLGLVWLAYTLWDNHQFAQRALEEEQLAQVTAQVWVATALYRDDPERYLTYRDSLLEVNDMPREKIFAFLENRGSQPEELLQFTLRVQQLVDSLSHIQDSLLREEKIRLADSIRTADTVSDATD